MKSAKEVALAPKRAIMQKKEAYNPEEIPFPVDALPKPLADLMRSYSEANGFNIEFQAAAAMSIFSACGGNCFKIQVKRGWVEAPVFWAAMVGNPSAMKTPVAKAYMKPLWALEKEWHKTYQDEKNVFEADDKSLPENEPQRREIVLNSSTMEALFKVHYVNKNGLLMFRDELLGWVKSMDQYRGKGDDEQIWLSIYSNDAIKVNRATKETQMISRAFVSVLGGIQPKVLDDLAGGKKDQNGFTYRISFFYPSDTSIPDWTEKEVDFSLQNLYNQAVTNVVQACEEDEKIVEINPDAKQLFIAWSNKNRQYLRLLDDDVREDIYKKLEATCIRVAGIVQLMKFGYGLDSRSYISIESMQSALQIIEYLRHTAIKAHQKMVKVEDKVVRAGELYREYESLQKVATMLGVSKTQVHRWKKKRPDLFIQPLKPV